MIKRSMIGKIELRSDARERKVPVISSRTQGKKDEIQKKDETTVDTSDQKEGRRKLNQEDKSLFSQSHHGTCRMC